MIRKVAIPANNGKLSSHFGHAKEFIWVELAESEIISNKSFVPPAHEPGVLPKWLGELGATDIIAGGMGQRAIQLFLDNNINVYVGVPLKPVLELVEDLLNNRLEIGANYCNH